MVYKTLHLMKLKALKAVFLVAPLPVYRVKHIFSQINLAVKIEREYSKSSNRANSNSVI